MAIDRRDVTLTNGGMRSTATTDFKAVVNSGLTESVGRLDKEGAADETTWHEARFDQGANRAATILWKRVFTLKAGAEKLGDSHSPSPEGNFTAQRSDPSFNSTESDARCKTEVFVKVETGPGFTADPLSVDHGVVKITVKNDATGSVWIDAKLNPILV
jgi:hypothetical protein